MTVMYIRKKQVVIKQKIAKISICKEAMFEHPV